MKPDYLGIHIWFRLLPDQIVKDLDLKFKTIEREVSSFTPEQIEWEGFRIINQSWSYRRNTR
jgi:hypothetical protein